MDRPPTPEFTVVERDGRLVIEKSGEKSRPEGATFQLPKLAAWRFDWIAFGQTLLTRRHTFDQTSDGDALLTSSQLERYIKLSSSSEDLYYLTPRQQAIIGYLALLHGWGGTIAIGTIIVFAALLDLSPFWLFLILMLTWIPLETYLKGDYEAIRDQIYVPTEPNEPAPC